jgi:carboxylate-amine ligase
MERAMQLEDRPTFGLEEEHLVVHRETGDPARMPKRCHDELARSLQQNFKREYKASQLELVTQRCPHDPYELIEEAAGNRWRANAILAKFDLVALPLGTHPTALAHEMPARGEHELAEHENARYRRIELYKGDAVHQLLVAGVHLHVGTFDLVEQLRTIPVLMHLVPLQAALTACSPWFEGREKNQSSWRLRVLMQLSSTLPTMVETEQELRQLQQAQCAAGVRFDASEQWALIRPGAGKQTVEFRAADTAPELDIHIGLAALIGSAVYAVRKGWLARPACASGQAIQVYLDNVEAAAAFGAAATMIDPFDDLRPKSVQEYARAWVDRCMPAIIALDLGTAITELLQRSDGMDPAQQIRALVEQAQKEAEACHLLPAGAMALAARRTIHWAWQRARISPAKPWIVRMRAAA